MILPMPKAQVSVNLQRFCTVQQRARLGKLAGILLQLGRSYHTTTTRGPHKHFTIFPASCIPRAAGCKSSSLPGYE